MTQYRHSPDQIDRMPPGVPYIVGNEAAERFSYYGMSSILVVFMTEHLYSASGATDFMRPAEANVWKHTFTMAVYFFPIVGAIISDWLLGKYYTIMSLSLLYCVGHGILALMDVPAIGVESRDLLWWGLACIAIGAGGIKPCVSAHVGDQFGQKNKHLLPRVFSWFYFSINVGSAISTLLIPYLLKNVGAWLAFGLPGILMAIATLAFWMGRHTFVHIPPARERFFRQTFNADGIAAMKNLIPLYVFIAMFWCLFDQSMAAWIQQAKSMDRNVFGVEILPTQVTAANPILVLILIPIFHNGIYPFLNRFFTLTPLRKIGIGMVVTAGAFAIVGTAQAKIDAGGTPHISWQLVAFVVLTSAEVMVSITALEFSYTQAPNAIKSVIMGLFLLSVSLGNLIAREVNKFIDEKRQAGSEMLEGASYYWFFMTLMLVWAGAYVVWSLTYKGRMHVQDDTEDIPPQDEHSLQDPNHGDA